MSLLRSYSFGFYNGCSEIPNELLSHCFSSLVESPEKHTEYALDIILRGLQGSIDFTKDFNIDAYEATIRHNLKMNKEGRKKKESYISSDDCEEDWDAVAMNGGIKMDVLSARAAEHMRDAYDELIQEDALRFAVETINSLREDLLIEERMDIVVVIKQALKCIPESVKMLKRVCSEYSVLAEQIQVILESGVDLDMLFACP